MVSFIGKLILLVAVMLLSTPAYAHLDGASHAGLLSYVIATVLTAVLFFGAVGVVHLFGRMPRRN